MSLYKESGVNIEEGYKSVQLMKQYTEKTFIPGVLNGLGSFAGMFELGQGYKNPVLVIRKRPMIATHAVFAAG